MIGMVQASTPPPRWMMMVQDLSSFLLDRTRPMRGPDRQRRAFRFRPMNGRMSWSERIWRELGERERIPMTEVAERSGVGPAQIRIRLLSNALEADVLREERGCIVRGRVMPLGVE